MLQTSLAMLIFSGIAKMNLAILAFLYCGEIVKNSSDQSYSMPYVLVGS